MKMKTEAYIHGTGEQFLNLPEIYQIETTN